MVRPARAISAGRQRYDSGHQVAETAPRAGGSRPAKIDTGATTADAAITTTDGQPRSTNSNGASAP